MEVFFCYQIQQQQYKTALDHLWFGTERILIQTGSGPVISYPHNKARNPCFLFLYTL